MMIGRPEDEGASSQADPTGEAGSGEGEGWRPSGERPADVDAYWQGGLEELAALPPAAEVDPFPLRSTDFADGYAVKLTSIGPYRLFAYYSVPRGDGPFPVIYHAPGYASVVQVPPYEERRRHIVLSLCARGQRLADRPFAASYPGLLTHGIDDPAGFVFRGIAADTVRGLDFLLARPEVDRERIAVLGNDMALLAAALRPEVRAVVVGSPLFYAAADLIPATTAYPWEEVNDYVRFYPERAAAVWRTLAYFDPLHLAGRVRAAAYLPHERPGGLLTAARLAPLTAALGGAVTLYELTGLGYTDRSAQETWLSQQLA
jgi:cephalosporin-C deacetylase